MKWLFPPLLMLLLAACAPGPQEPVELEPVAPTTEAESVESGVTVTPAEPGALPEVPPLTGELTAEPAAPTPEAEAEPAAPTPEGEAEAEAAPSAAPQGTIGISADNTSFTTSAADELNPVTLTAGGSFYLQLDFTDPDGISAAQVELRNSAAAGTLPTGPFTVAASDCEAALASAPTDLTCTLTVAIAPDAQNIGEAGETAYAFRPLVTDTLGNSELVTSWAYLIVEPQ